MPPKTKIKIQGEEFPLGPINLGFWKWVDEVYQTKDEDGKPNKDGQEQWLLALGRNDPDTYAETIFRLLPQDAQSKFKTPKDLLNIIPGDTGYLLVVFCKLLILRGVGSKEVEQFDEENMGRDEIKKLNDLLTTLRKEREAENQEMDPRAISLTGTD